MPKQQKPIRYWLPNPFFEKLKTEVCSCGTKITRADVIAVGIREHTNPKGEKRDAVYFEFKCSQCGYRAIKIVENAVRSLEEFCFFFLEKIKNRKQIDKSRHVEARKVKKTNRKISEFEQKRMSSFLKDHDNYSDFLRFIGAYNLLEDHERSDETEKNT